MSGNGKDVMMADGPTASVRAEPGIAERNKSSFNAGLRDVARTNEPETTPTPAPAPIGPETAGPEAVYFAR